MIIIISSSCDPRTEKKDKWEIKGSWYYAETWGDEPSDSTIDYTEMYFNDSTYYPQTEAFGQTYDRKYKVSGDSLFFEDKDSQLVSFYKIDRFVNDTIWLISNPKYIKNLVKKFWVRFPANEKGHYEYNWNPEDADSLEWAIVYDYDRRKFKYYATLANRLGAYDSALKAGRWNWTMKDEQIQERLEREKKWKRNLP